MIHAVLVLGLAALAAIAPPVFQQDISRPRAASDTRTRDVYVSVQDNKDAPVTGLRAADFQVREDGAPREVLRAETATAPLQIVLLVDDSEALNPALQPMREGLTKFVEKMQGHGEIGIVTVGERSTSLVQPTTDVNALKQGITRIFARPGSGAYMLDGIQEVSQGFQRREAQRPHIIGITMDAVEFSNLRWEMVLKTLNASGATLDMLSIGMPSSSMADEMRNLNQTIAEGTKDTGGRRDQVLATSGIPDALLRVADDLLNQYVVTYGRPERLIPPEKLQVTVSKPDVSVRAPTRLAGK
jgi:Ca-activated chloride channel homolog